ncbi:hypothetical protein FHR24_002714 [Wenyingzhuangia heitensis]|uniref:Uncharacterized protein n=1 Tax=Wenyingzhuangia heitensis TaxID=1487859 RepID=A0ABX0UBM1_9FLAO|nr:hypothetical protein [Wenyingzhuangia heitensis]NIJ46230.1 hypothetical protein [Wenyingzhuangia heitensis]
MVGSRFSFDVIKYKTSELESEFYLDNQPPKKELWMSNEFLEKYIFPQPIAIGYFNYSPSKYTNAYAFKAYKEFLNFDLFTFIYNNDDGCRIVYGATTLKDTLQILSTGVIGFVGDDGAGWIGEKKGKWVTPFIFNAIEISNYDDDFVATTNNSQIDTIWSTIHINSKGIFKETVTKEVHYRDGRKIQSLN